MFLIEHFLIDLPFMSKLAFNDVPDFDVYLYERTTSFMSGMNVGLSKFHLKHRR